MKSAFKFCVFVVSVGFAASALAAADAPAGSGPNPYSDCGIGAALFPKTPVGAVISNVIWDVGTTAVTSAVSSPQTCSGKKVAAAEFILRTYAALEEEAVVGRGDHLASALTLMGCGAGDHQKVFDGLQADLGSVMDVKVDAAMNQVEKSSRIYNLLQKNISESSTCSA